MANEQRVAPPFVPGLVAGITPPLIGRDAELQQLLERFYAMIEGGGAQLVTVLGDPGIGKSRLAFEFHQWVARLPETVQFYAFRSDRQLASWPYNLLRQLVVALFRINPSDPIGVAKARIEGGVSALLGAGQVEKAHFIGQIAGYNFSASPHLRGVLDDPRQVRDRALHYAAQCVAALTARAPLVLVLDDLHEADDGSLDAIGHLVEVSAGHSLLVIGLAQARLSERRPAWGQRPPRATTLALQPLTEHDSRRLVAEILRKAGRLPNALHNLVVGQAEGNPFYIEELLKTLVADGTIVPGAEQWQIHSGRLSRLRIPGTLSELLNARLQALTAQERDFLLRAAVVGRTFWPGGVEHLQGLDQAIGEPTGRRAAVTAEQLAALTGRGLIVAQPESRFVGEQEFSFKHELLHKVAYEQVATDERQGYHQSAASWLSVRPEVQAGAFAGMIAEHYERAGQPGPAGEWHLRAGQRSFETYAVDEATEHFRHALALLPHTPAFAEIRLLCYESLAESQLAAARLGEALASYTQMRELAAEIGDRKAEARAWNGLAFVYDNQVEPRLAHESATHAVALAEPAGDVEQQVLGMVRQAWAALRLDNLAEAMEIGQRALALAESNSDAPAVSRAKGVIGLAYEYVGDYAQAVRQLEEALEVNFVLGDLRQVTIHLNNLGYLANLHGDYVAARRFLEEDLRICAEIGSRMGELYALSNLATTLNGLGEHASAESVARRGIQICEASRSVAFSDFYRELALACLGDGRVDEGLEAAQQALDLATRAESPREMGAAWRALGLAIGRLSDPQGAPHCFAQSVRLLAGAGAAGERGRTLRDWAAHALANGDEQNARSLLAEAYEIFLRAGLTHELARTPVLPDSTP